MAKNTKKDVLIAAVLASVVSVSLCTNAFAKSISLSELQSSQASYVPTVKVSAKDFDNRHWAYKSLEEITKKYGLLVGEAGSKFDGAKPLTRNEASVILVNLLGKIEQDKLELDDSERIQINILKNELTEEINALAGRVDALEGTVGKLQGTVTKVQENDKKNLKYGFGEDFKVGGVLQLKYAGIFTKADSTYSSPNTPNFQIPLSEFRFSGKMSPKVNYMASMVVNRTWGSTTTGGVLGDAYISTTAVPKHTIFFGQTRIPIGIEGTTSPTALNTIERSMIARNFSDYRDMGVKVAGSYPILDYYLGLYNGAGQNLKDSTRNMGFGAFGMFKPLFNNPEYGKLGMGGGYYRQENASSTTTTRYEQQTWSAALDYKYKKVGLRNEWAVRRGNGTTETAFPRRGNMPVGRGMFVEGTYDLTKKAQLVAKYDMYDANQRIKEKGITEATIGTNYFFAGNNIKLQVNGVLIKDHAGRDSKRVLVMTQYAF